MHSKRLMKRGAEATLYEAQDYMGFVKGRVVHKVRLPKRYRNKALDERLIEERIRTETKLMTETRALGISIPIIYDIDLVGKRIVMEHILGRTVKEILDSDFGDKRLLCKKIGTLIGTLHKNDIVHGDLTTSNMILSNDKLYFIDFSLGQKSSEIEDKGVDLHLLHEALKSSHPTNSGLFESVLEGYSEAYDHARKVADKMIEIEKRGRYT